MARREIEVALSTEVDDIDISKALADTHGSILEMISRTGQQQSNCQASPSFATQHVMIAQGIDFTEDFSTERNSRTISDGEKFIVESRNKRGRALSCETRVSRSKRLYVAEQAEGKEAASSRTEPDRQGR